MRLPNFQLKNPIHYLPSLPSIPPSIKSKLESAQGRLHGLYNQFKPHQVQVLSYVAAGGMLGLGLKLSDFPSSMASMVAMASTASGIGTYIHAQNQKPPLPMQKLNQKAVKPSKINAFLAKTQIQTPFVRGVLAFLGTALVSTLAYNAYNASKTEQKTQKQKTEQKKSESEQKTEQEKSESEQKTEQKTQEPKEKKPVTCTVQTECKPTYCDELPPGDLKDACETDCLRCETDTITEECQAKDVYQPDKLSAKCAEFWKHTIDEGKKKAKDQLI